MTGGVGFDEEPEPLRARGLVHDGDRLVEVEVEVPPGPTADAIREGALRGLLIDLDP